MNWRTSAEWIMNTQEAQKMLMKPSILLPCSVSHIVQSLTHLPVSCTVSPNIYCSAHDIFVFVRICRLGIGADARGQRVDQLPIWNGPRVNSSWMDWDPKRTCVQSSSEIDRLHLSLANSRLWIANGCASCQLQSVISLLHAWAQ